MMRLLLSCLLVLLCMPSPSSAQSAQIDVSKLGAVPVQMDGRVRPLSSLADILYQDLTGYKIKHHTQALDFFALALFDPAEAATHKVITIENATTIQMLQLDPNQSFFALSDITPALTKISPQIEQWVTSDLEDLTPYQTELLELTDKIITFTQVMRSFTAILPLDIEIPEDLKNRLNSPYYNYLNLISYEEKISQKARQYQNQDLETLNQDQLAYMLIFEQIAALRQGGQTNDALRVIPDSGDVLYYSPWDLLLSGKASPKSLTLLSTWGQLAYAYRQNDQQLFDQTVPLIKEQSNDIRPYDRLKISVETIYLIINPLLIGSILYGLSLVFLCSRKYSLGIALGGIGALLHAVMIGARVYILDRAPVATLFESILFVGFLCVITLLAMWFKSKNRTYFHLGIGLGFLLHIVAAGFTQNNDSFGLIQAVLNTNFWLMIHVLIISAGYATSLITSIMAQLYLYKKSLINLSIIKIFLAISLLLVTFGTILGGLWADQSWGRFWGWDPKENGALLIILWITWIMHGVLSGHLSQKTYIISMGALSMIVALAWFGVNLLSIGLHSYGFASGVGLWLFVFMAVQTLILLYLGRRYDQEHKT